MIPDPFAHFCLMAGLVAYSLVKRSGNQFLFVLLIYGAAWQVSDYISYQEDAPLFLKIFFQNFISIVLIHFIIQLDYTRFTALFIGLLLLTVASLFTMMMLDKFATAELFNSSIGIFSMFNIQLMYLELLALAGITFDMGSGKTIIRKPVDDYLRGSAHSSGAMGCAG